MGRLTAKGVLGVRWWWLLPGVLAAAVLGAVVSGQAGVGPFDGSRTRAAVASVQFQVDTPAPLLGDLTVSELSVATQALLLADRLTGEDAREAIARRAGVPAEELAVLSARTTIPGRSSPLSREAVAASRLTSGRFRIDVGVATGVPVITVLASAPERRTALRLAEAAAPVLDTVTGTSPADDRRRVRLRLLAPPRTRGIVDGGPSPLRGLGAALVTLGGWWWIVLVAGRARMRRGPALGWVA